MFRRLCPFAVLTLFSDSESILPISSMVSLHLSKTMGTEREWNSGCVHPDLLDSCWLQGALAVALSCQNIFFALLGGKDWSVQCFSGEKQKACADTKSSLVSIHFLLTWIWLHIYHKCPELRDLAPQCFCSPWKELLCLLSETAE